MAPVYLPQFVRCGLWPENEIWLLQDKETQHSYPNVDWTGKRGVFMAAMLRILGAKKFHGGGVYMSFSFDWTAISRNKSQVNWGKSKVKSFATKSCSKLVQSFNRLNDFRTSTLMCCRTSYRYFHNCRYKLRVIVFIDACGLLFVLPVIIFRVFSSKDNIFCFHHRGRFSVANHYFPILSAHFLVLSFPPLYFWVNRYPSPTTYHIYISGRKWEGCLFQFLSFSPDHPAFSHLQMLLVTTQSVDQMMMTTEMNLQQMQG